MEQAPSVTERLFNGPLFPHHGLLYLLLLNKLLFVLFTDHKGMNYPFGLYVAVAANIFMS